MSGPLGFTLLCGWLGVQAAWAAPGCPPAAWTTEALEQLKAREFAIGDPAERQALALALLPCLEEPNPLLRDEIAFTAYATWLRGGQLDAATRETLAGLLTARLEAGDPEPGFARPFAALVLSEVARADRLDPTLASPRLLALVDAAVAYLVGVRDYRGFDPIEGWRHGVAQGADLALQLGLHPALPPAKIRDLLDAIASQVAPRGEVFFQHGEPERLARAVYFIHQRGGLGDDTWDAWFASRGAPEPLADWSEAWSSRLGLAKRHNTVAFLFAVSFAARQNPGEASGRLAALADRELVRIGGW